MDKRENEYCRFCAEQKKSNKLIDLQTDTKKCEETLLKLEYMNAIFIDVSEENNLPKTVCFICYDSLNKAYDFLNKIEKSQKVLTDLLQVNDTSKFDLSDDDRTALDDFFDNVEDNKVEIKEEIPSPSKRKLDSHLTNSFSHNIEIKIEPKEEYIEPASINVVSEAIRDSPSDFDNTLNVIDSIYCKESSDVGKEVVNSWKDYLWVCAYCKKEFLDVDALRYHSKIVHGKCAAFFCIDCKTRRRGRFVTFVSHIRKHREHLRKYCHYCDELLHKYKNLHSHVKEHFQKSQISCPACGEILKNEDVLQQHLLEYNSTKPKRKRGTPITVEDLTCKLCQKVYKNLNSLRDHMKLHTNRKRNYTCDRCGKAFFSKGTLTAHIMSHDKVRPHVCKICNLSFLFLSKLQRHVQMHGGIKPYSCDQCGRCFGHPERLNSHKIVHTDSMPHVCQYCNKAFRFRKVLKVHERQHTGAKPYSCQQCIREFRNWSNYNKHMQLKHGKDTSKKKITPKGVFPINPKTGQIIEVDKSVDTEEWISKIMIPGKRGKKKAIKEENVNDTYLV